MAGVIRAAARGGRDEAVPDGELLARYAGGPDDAAFATLVRRHAGMVLGVARRVLGDGPDAEDVCQAAFLLLARKSSGGLRRESVAGWLCTTARLTALNARKARDRRARAEARARRAVVPPPPTPLERMTGAELVSALDEELARLPDRYRGPLVLCCLEGLAGDDAARRLGVPVGTLRVQLARGRERLRAALGKRGIELGAALLAVTVAPAVGAARPQLVESVLAAVGGTVPSAVAALSQGVTAMTKPKLLLVAALGVGLAGAAVVGAVGGFSPAAEARADAQDKPAAPAAKPSPGGPAADANATVRGRVVTPDGKPAAGAKLFLVNSAGLLRELGTTDASGRFAVDVSQRGTRSGRGGWLAARAAGFGVDFADLGDRAPAAEVELRLPADRPIRGRVIDLQGQPVAGATVRLNALSVYGADTVEPFLAGLLKRPDLRSRGATPTRVMFGGTRSLITAATDKDGRFELAGAGAERVVGLRITGPGIAQTHAEVVTRTGFDPELYNAVTRALRPKNGQRLPGAYPPVMLLGPDATVVAEAEKPVRGVVTEADTGAPRAGVQVVMFQDNGTQQHRLEATTGRDGRYEVRGAFKAPQYTLAVESDPAAGMVRRTVTVRDTPGLDPVAADIRTARGVVVTGRVTDGTTGKPMPGSVWVAPLVDNPHARKPEYDSFADAPREETGPDGTFRVVAIPGRVLLMAGADSSRLPGGDLESLRYRLPTPDPRFPAYFQSDGVYLSYQAGQGYRAVQGNYCKVLDVPPEAAEVRADVVLEQDSATTVSLRDGAGRPVAGTWLHGLTEHRYISAFWYESAEVEVYGVQKDKPRVVAVFDPKHNLTATVTLRGDEKQPVVVTLGPPGTLKGRLLNPDGAPAAGVTVSVAYPDKGARGVQQVFKAAQESDGCVVTDKGGAFRFDRMIPGHSFSLLHSPPSKQGLPRTPTRFVAGGRKFGPVKPGETTDLGDLTLKPAGPGDEP
jgi:RNA polymerase sigma factor (sigma-70 family)